jgi:hypothetical protein
VTRPVDDRTWELIAAAVPHGARVLAPEAPAGLVQRLTDRSCAVSTEVGAHEPVEVAVLARTLDLVDDPRQLVKDLAARLAPGGLILLVAPTAAHAALRIALGAPTAVDPLARAAIVAWPATIDLLEDLGLHLWFDLPVAAGLLAGTGIEPSTVSPEVLATLEGDPDRSATAVVVAAGPDPRPTGDGDLVGALVAETATLRHRIDELSSVNRDLVRDADAARQLRERSSELRAQVVGLRAELDAIQSSESLRDQYIASLEQELDDERDQRSRGIFRLALRIDRHMLASPLLRRLHRVGGRAVRALDRGRRR